MTVAQQPPTTARELSRIRVVRRELQHRLQSLPHTSPKLPGYAAQMKDLTERALRLELQVNKS